jgi:hypothetical protein
MEEMLIDTPCFHRFVGCDMIDDRIPDETTILNFRHLLEEHTIAEQILESVNQSLSEKGVMLIESVTWTPETEPVLKRASYPPELTRRSPMKRKRYAPSSSSVSCAPLSSTSTRARPLPTSGGAWRCRAPT